jgi:Leucine-rich repeat (LRR) protein
MPKLQSLNLSNNVLREVVGLENLTSLTSLVLNKNFLKSFNFRKNINLKVLSLATNTFSKIKSLDVRGLKNLEYLDCSFNNLEELKSEDCEKLKTLDADGNSFKNLDFPYLPNLENLSLLSNDYGNPESKNLTLNSPNLKYLVTRNSNIKEIVHKLGLNNELKLISNQTQREIYKDLSTEELIQA